ncbi:MAG: hypothetical protein IJ583_11065, partial [Firmicutes bacterium]|nr:hypothetical protein [Bacillota bacterium]
DIKPIAVCLAEKLHGIFTVGFYDDGSLYFEAVADEDDFDFDEIGAHLEIEKLKREQKEMIDSLMLWYKIFRKGKSK